MDWSIKMQDTLVEIFHALMEKYWFGSKANVQKYKSFIDF